MTPVTAMGPMTAMKASTCLINSTAHPRPWLLAHRLGYAPTQRQPDISRAREYVNNWQIQVQLEQLEQGLQKTIAYFD